MTTQHTTQELGKFEKVEDIREIWPTENENFTPWLAEAENISELGSALGLNLEVIQQEASVGRFRLDVLAKELGTDRYVAIENQYNQSDHDHLGKLLTYTAGHKAKVAVWLAERFEDEHLEALALLNKPTDLNNPTDDDAEFPEFFGVKIEAWKIGDSLVAPMFDVVAAPDGWTKDNKIRRQGEVSERGEKYLEFFQPLVESLRNDQRFPNKNQAHPNSWELFVSHGPAQYRSVFGTKKHRVELYISRGNVKEIYDNLEHQKEDIETEIGTPLSWERMDTNVASRISIVGDGGIDDEDRHEEIREWMADYLRKFVDVFRPRLGPILEELAERSEE